MLTTARGTRVYLAAEPVDLRRGHDGLTALDRTRFGLDLLDGHLFVFVGRRVDRVKILFWDRGGFVLYYKRLARGRFRMPKSAPGADRVVLDGTELAMLLGGFGPRRRAPRRCVGASTPLARRLCDNALRPVGAGKSSTLYEHVRPHFRKRVFHRETLSCKCGHIITAPAPARVAEKTRYAPSVIAHLVVAKCNDSIPQSRLEKAYKQIGIPICRSTMCDLFHRAAAECRAIYDAALALVPRAPGVHADETSIRQQGLERHAFL